MRLGVRTYKHGGYRIERAADAYDEGVRCPSWVVIGVMGCESLCGSSRWRSPSAARKAIDRSRKVGA